VSAGRSSRVEVPRAAFAFVMDNSDRLRKYAASQLWRRRIPGGRLEADDVVNYTVIALFQNWAAIEHPERYMFTVARHFMQRAAYDGQRFTGSEPTEGNNLDQFPPDQATYVSMRMPPPVEDQAEARHNAAQLHEAMTALSPQQRQAIELLELAGLSREEAAAEMGVAVGTLSMHRDRALKNLQKRLVELGCFLATVVVAGFVVVLKRYAQGERPFPALGLNDLRLSSNAVLPVGALVLAAGIIAMLILALRWLRERRRRVRVRSLDLSPRVPRRRRWLPTRVFAGPRPPTPQVPDPIPRSNRPVWTPMAVAPKRMSLTGRMRSMVRRASGRWTTDDRRSPNLGALEGEGAAKSARFARGVAKVIPPPGGRAQSGAPIGKARVPEREMTADPNKISEEDSQPG
jgi:RNA polymerase sigma factor (sigma-70 family)